MKSFAYMAILLLQAFTAKAQELPPKTQQQLERWAEAAEDQNPEDESLQQQLAYYKKHPLNINTASPDELRQLGLLTDLQIYNLLRYRGKLGNLINVYELQAVPTWDVLTIYKVLPFITVLVSDNLKQSLLQRFNGGDRQLLLRVSGNLEKAKGYNSSTQAGYRGDRSHVLLRYRYQYKNLLQYGFVAEKDAGEPFIYQGRLQGFDFYSAHLFARNLGRIKALALGDFTVNLGQGLVQWQAFGFAKSAEVSFIKRQAPIIMPYRSAGEYNFSRGAAVTLQQRQWEATVFLSSKRFSANVVDAETFSSFLTSGYHRTAAELSDKNSTNDFSFGGNVNFQHKQFKIGFNAVSHQFSRRLERRNEPYNYFSFAGKRLWNASIDYAITSGNVHVFGEAAVDQHFNKAMVNGALISADEKIDVAILHRTLQKTYQSLFGNAFTENLLPGNESGLYAGITLRPLDAWQVSAYADVFSFPWLRYRADAPGSGSAFLLQVDFSPNRQTSFYTLFRSKSKPLNTSAVVVNTPTDQLKKNFRINMVQQFSRIFSLKTRAEWVWFNHAGVPDENESGFLIYLEPGYTSNMWRGNLRVQYFTTNGYNSRLYAYESDVLYSFSVPAFFDTGFRYYLNLQCELGMHLNGYLRFAQTIVAGAKTLGSGLDAVNGNKRSEIKLQLIGQF